MRDPRLRLEDILEAIAAIDRYASRGRDAFLADELIQNWILRHIQVIGEAVSHLRDERPDWLAQHPEVPWDEVVGMRNRLVHGYFRIRLEPVWDAVENGLPVMKRVASALLQSS